jgi:hypothetical protein
MKKLTLAAVTILGLMTPSFAFAEPAEDAHEESVDPTPASEAGVGTGAGNLSLSDDGNNRPTQAVADPQTKSD